MGLQRSSEKNGTRMRVTLEFSVDVIPGKFKYLSEPTHWLTFITAQLVYNAIASDFNPKINIQSVEIGGQPYEGPVFSLRPRLSSVPND